MQIKKLSVQFKTFNIRPQSATGPSNEISKSNFPKTANGSAFDRAEDTTLAPQTFHTALAPRLPPSPTLGPPIHSSGTLQTCASCGPPARLRCTQDSFGREVRRGPLPPRLSLITGSRDCLDHDFPDRRSCCTASRLPHETAASEPLKKTGTGSRCGSRPAARPPDRVTVPWNAGRNVPRVRSAIWLCRRGTSLTRSFILLLSFSK